MINWKILSRLNIKTYLQKTVIYLLITAILLPYFPSATPTVKAALSDFEVVKTVRRDTAIVGDGWGNGGANFSPIDVNDPGPMHTNVLEYSTTITNISGTTKVVNINASIPENTVYFFDKDYNDATIDARMLTGTVPGGANNTVIYTEVCYSWAVSPATPAPATLYHRSIASATLSGAPAVNALEKITNVTLTTTLDHGDTMIFIYHVLVWTSGITGYVITDNLTIDGEATVPIVLDYFNPTYSITADAIGTVASGDEITYTIDLRSIGTQAEVELEIPAGTSYQTGSLNTGVLTPTDLVVAPTKINFTLLSVPHNSNFDIVYKVIVDANAVSVNNTQSSVNGVLLDPIYLNVAAGDLVFTGYTTNAPPSEGIIAGQEITYTAFVNATSGVISTSVATIILPAGTSFVNATNDNIGGYTLYPNENPNQIEFNFISLDSTPASISFTLKLLEAATGDLNVHFENAGTPSAWKHPILTVFKSLEKNSTVATGGSPVFTTTNTSSPVMYKDLIKYVYTITNTGTLPVTSASLNAHTPNDMALYLMFGDMTAAFGVADYGRATFIRSPDGIDDYYEVAYDWAVAPGFPVEARDYLASIEATENNLSLPNVFYAPFEIFKENVVIAPGDSADLRFAAFVNTDIIGSEFHDAFTVNGVPTPELMLMIPGYSVVSDRTPYTTVVVGDIITYTLTKPIQAAALVYADIPTGTSLVADSVTLITDSGENVTVLATVDSIEFIIPAGIASGTTTISYSIKVERPVKVIINNFNVNDNYLDTIAHKMTTAANGVILGYTFTSHLNNNYIGYGDSMTFKYFVQNNTLNPLTNVVITVPIDDSVFILNPGSIPYWFGDAARIVDKDNIPCDPYDFLRAIDDPDFKNYNDYAPVSVQWTIPFIDVGQIVSVITIPGKAAATLSFSGNIKSAAEVPGSIDIFNQTATLTADDDIVAYPELLVYYFPPRTFVTIESNVPSTLTKSPSGETLFTSASEYKYGDRITYKVCVTEKEVTLLNMVELFISSTIPAGSTLDTSSIFVRKDGIQIFGSEIIIDTINPGKIRIRILNPEQSDYSVEYSVVINSYIGVLKTYAIGQVVQSQEQSDSTFLNVAVAASETDILHHNYQTSYSIVTINKQILVDSNNTELSTILQSIEGVIGQHPVDFIITFTDPAGNEYNAIMQNGETDLQFYGLPYNIPLTINEISTSDTVFKEVKFSSGGANNTGVYLVGDKYTFMLKDTDVERQLNFTIVSEYRPQGGFSSAASRNNMFAVPNYDFTSLLKFQLQDLASTQLDNGSGDGAIPISDDALSYNFATQRFSIRPYFSMTVANAFLLDPDYYDNAKRYIEWHINHLEQLDVYGVPGSIYDYFYSLIGDERRAYTMAESDNTVDVYDSTDSYAALFYDLLLNYVEVTGDPTNILSRTVHGRPLLDLILDCLDFSLSNASSVENEVYLTVAKPKNFEMEYLMDNCEVYWGFLCLEELYNKMGNTPGANIAATYANRIKNGIEGLLYNNTNQNYDYALLNTSSVSAYYYPDAIAQLFPIIFDVLTPTDPKAIELYDNQFLENFPYWTDMTNLHRDGYTPKINRGGGASIYPNALIFKAAIKMGDLDNTALGFLNVEKLFRQNGNPQPFLCYESGETANSIYRYMNAYYKWCSQVYSAVPKFSAPYVVN